MNTLTSIHVYPVKSCGAIDLDEAEVLPQGLALDRRWMLVDANGRFITQRKHPQMARIRVSIVDSVMRFEFDQQAPLELPLKPAAGPRLMVDVWEDTVDALDLTDLCGDWFQQIFAQPVSLVYMDAIAKRIIKAKYQVQPQDTVSFADGLPLLLATHTSLKYLEEKVGTSLGMARFRPNVVVTGGDPFSENDWKRVRIGSIEFDVTNPCVRCEITKVDQQTGEKWDSTQPLSALTDIRGYKTKAMFGVNLVPRGAGNIHVGDPFEVLA